jgi:hypothetical protein
MKPLAYRNQLMKFLKLHKVKVIKKVFVNIIKNGWMKSCKVYSENYDKYIVL